MTLADHFDEADVLHTLSWVGMSLKARIAKLAKLYLDREDDIRYAHRNYGGPTLGTVRIFIKSLYTPPRGQGKVTYEGVLAEIPRQRACRKERAKRQPWVWTKPKKKERRNAVAAAVMSVWTIDRWDNKKKIQVNPNCVGITQLAGCRLIVDGGTSSYHHEVTTQPRIFVRHLATGRSKVVVVEGKSVSSVTQMLTRIAPKDALRGAFGGKNITFDYDGEGFLVDGELVPWRNIRKVYPGEKAHKTKASPKKEKD